MAKPVHTPDFLPGRVRALFILALASVAMFWVSLPALHSSQQSPLTTVQASLAPIWPLASASAVDNSLTEQKVFPYSVIPGGAQSAQELTKAVQADRVVARHYSDFDLSRVRRVTLSTPQLMYVSYRIGNDVFWTKRKLTLRKGETLLTDGRSMARTRCGNRVAVSPVRPVSLHEPTSEDFDAPELPPSVSTPYLAAFSAPAPPLFSHAQPSVSPSTPLIPFFPVPGGGGGVPSVPPTGGGGGGGGGGGKGA
jgi:hypothetical protein